MVYSESGFPIWNTRPAAGSRLRRGESLKPFLRNHLPVSFEFGTPRVLEGDRIRAQAETGTGALLVRKATARKGTHMKAHDFRSNPNPGAWKLPSETLAATPAATATRARALSHDARNMVTALSLYCDLLDEPGVLAEGCRHYANELRLVTDASRRLVEKLGRLEDLPEVTSARARCLICPNFPAGPDCCIHRDLAAGTRSQSQSARRDSRAGRRRVPARARRSSARSIERRRPDPDACEPGEELR